MAAAQSVDEKQGVIFQGLQQQTWFEPETLDHYIAALLKIAVARKEDPQMRIPDPVQIEKVGAVSLKTIQETLARFNAGLEGLGLKDADLFDPVDLTMLRVRISWVAEYTPPPPASNMPNPELMQELLRNAHEVEAANAETGRPSTLDAQIKASLELFRQAQALKITTVNRLMNELWKNSSYIKDIAAMEHALGDDKAKEALRTILMNEANIVADQFTLKMLADLYHKDPSEAVATFMKQLQHRIGRDDFLRTALGKLPPEEKARVMREIEGDAHETVKYAQPNAQAIRKEQTEAAKAHSTPDHQLSEDTFSLTRRPIAEARRLTRAAITATVNVKVLNAKLLLAAHHVEDKHLRHLLSSPFSRQRIIAFLIQHPNPAVQQKYLLRVFRGMSMEDIRQYLDLVTTFQTNIRRLSEFTPQTLHDAAEMRPDLLPRSVLRLFTETVSTPLSVEQASVVRNAAVSTRVPADVVAIHATGVSKPVVAAMAAQIPASHQARPLFERFQQHFDKLQQALRPPKVPTEASVVSESVASEVQSMAAVSRVPTSFVGRTLRSIGASAPVQFITTPFRRVGDAVSRGVTGVRNWAVSGLKASAAAVGKNLVTWGTAQAAKAGIMGFAGKAAVWAGAQLGAAAVGKFALQSIPVIGQAIGAVQAVGGATLGFLGSTLDFIRGKKSFGEWGASAFKSAGTLIGAAVGGLLGGAIGLLGLGVGAIPGALIGVVIGAMVGGMLTGGLAAFSKKPEEVLKSLFGLLLMGGFALAAFAQWALAHVGALIGGTIGATIGMYFGSTALSILGFGLCGPLCAAAGWWVGGIIGGVAGGLIGTAIGWAFDTFLQPALTSGGQLITLGAAAAKYTLATAGTAFGQLVTLGTASIGRVLSAAGTTLSQLLTIGQIGLRGLLGWIGQAGMTLGGSILGGIGGFFMGGAPGALLGGGLGAVGGSWLASGGLNNFLSGIGPAMTNSVVAATNFLGSLTAPLAASQIISTTTAVAMGGIAAAGGITALFVIPTILSALYVPPEGGTTSGPGGPIIQTCATIPAGTFAAQIDPAWASIKAPPPNDTLKNCTIGASGCGSASMTMISRIFGSSVGIVDVWNEQHNMGGYLYQGDKCMTQYSPGLNILTNRGLSVAQLADLGEVKQVLTGCGVVMAGGTMKVASGNTIGHILVVTGISEDANGSVVAIETLDPAYLDGDRKIHQIGTNDYQPVFLFSVVN